MKVSVFGTGMVGKTIAARLAGLGHQVTIAGRGAECEELAGWRAPLGIDYAAYHSALDPSTIVVALNGVVVLDVLRALDPSILSGKLVIDVSNPLATSKGGMPTLLTELSNTTSLGEEIQRLLPEALVVKTLNTMNHLLMVDPARIPGPHDVFLCGNDPSAKARVRDLLAEFGWRDPIDLGPIEAARGMEGMMPFWLRAWAALGTADFNYHLARG